MFRWIQNHLGVAANKVGRVGVDIGAQGLRVVCMNGGLDAASEQISHRRVPLARGVINGAEIEDIDEVARQLCLVVDELSLQGCQAAFSFPSMATRCCEIDPTAYKTLCHRPDEEVIEYLLERLRLPKGEWCFDWGERVNGTVSAVVARQPAVMDRYAVAEMAQLSPTVLDLERMAADRVFEWLCQHGRMWPQLWIRWSDGLLFVHAQIAPEQGTSAVRYCWQMADLISVLESLLDELSQASVWSVMPERVLAVRFSGLGDVANGLMEVVVQRWPHAICVGMPDHGVLTELLEDDWSVALGLALHPGLR
jgi:hypothetical protein